MNNSCESLSVKKSEFLQTQVYNEVSLTLYDAFLIAEEYSHTHNIKIYVKNYLRPQGIEVKTLFKPNSCDEVGYETSIDAINNILNIQKTLAVNQYAGYLHTSVNEGVGHFECFIISHEQIIKPISWQATNFGYDCKTVMGECLLKAPQYRYSFIDADHWGDKEYIPQADGSSCGSICLSYLKNMLQNDAMQLREFCLSVPYYNADNKLQYFFIPSPFVLRYTQISAYNQYIRELIESTNNDNTSLAHMLNSCIKKIKSSKHFNNTFKDKIRIEAQSHLNALPEFRQKWIKEYDRVHAKRELMRDQHNRYLAYTAHRLTIKSHLIHQRQHNPALQLLDVLGTMAKELKKEYLQTELSKIDFCTPYDVAYFLYMIEDEFREQCFFLLKNHTFQYEHWELVTIFLNTTQKRQLINDLKNSTKTGELITQKASTIFSWLETWQCTVEEKKYLIGLFVPLDIAKKQLVLLRANDLHFFIREYCVMLNNFSYIFNLLSQEVILALKKHSHFPLWHLLQYVETYFSADIAADFLLRHRFLFIEEYLCSTDYYFFFNNLKITFKSLLEKTDFFNLSTAEFIEYYKQLILDERLKNAGDKLAVFLNQLPLTTRSILLVPTLNKLKSFNCERTSPPRSIYSFIITVLKAIPLDQRRIFLVSALDSEEKTTEFINAYALNFLMLNTTELDLNILKSPFTTSSTNNSSHKRPFGELSDFDFYFFPAQTIRKSNSELTSDVPDMSL